MSATPSQEFTAWIFAQQLPGISVEQVDERHLLLHAAAATGEVNFYTIDDSTEIAELKAGDDPGEPGSFYLHFDLADLARAQELFGELVDTLTEAGTSSDTPVLLCCSCGITTNMMAAKMNQISETLGLGYRFTAKPLDAAEAGGEAYAAVMLAPQVASLRSRIADAFPSAAVFEIPAKIFGSYDAAGAVRLAIDVVEQYRTGMGDPFGQAGESPMPRADELNWNGRILVISTVYGARASSVEYRIYEGGELTMSGLTTKRTFDFRTVEEVFATLRVRGVDVRALDAVGIAVPGIIKGGSVSFLGRGIHDYELAEHIEQAYGVAVYLDNDANAAAVGCYVTQDRYDNIAYHRESYGDAGCGQGNIVNGKIVCGRANFAGELTHMTHAFAVDGVPEEIAWTEEGMYELVSRFLLANICVLSPEAIYVDSWPATDMDRMREKLLPYLGEEYLPELIPAPDFNECMFIGELALCVQRLRARGPRRATGYDFMQAYLLNK